MREREIVSSLPRAPGASPCCRGTIRWPASWLGGAALSQRAWATVEWCPSCNLVLGAVPSYEAHPIRRLAEAGIPVTLNTDNPIRSWTTIGREYAIAAALGFSLSDLAGFTRSAIRASFTTAARRAELVEKLRRWGDGRPDTQPSKGA